MAEILLVNPRRRRRKLSAKQRKYFGKRRKRRARAAAPRRRRRRSNPIAGNPRRRRRRRNPSFRRRSRRRRNPSLRGIVNQIQPAVKAGLVGAAGGLGLSVALGYLQEKLPAQLQSGYGLTAVKVLGAILVGVLGNQILRGKGNQLATGAMTVVAYDEVKKLMAAQFPGVPLGEYISFAPVVGYESPLGTEGMSGMGEYMDANTLNGMGEYVSDSDDSGGY